jgi:RHS repeat-associated protein
MHSHLRQNNTFTGLSGGQEALFAAPHRFTFNGQERDDEMSGEGNSLSFKYRIEDSRLGRFFSVDPLFKEYEYNSTYAFAENDVIRYLDLEGLEKGTRDTWKTSVKISTGDVGIKVKLFGVGLSLTYSTGSNQVTYSLFRSRTNGSQSRVGASLETKETLPGVTNVTIGPYTHSEEESKKKIYEWDFENEPTEYTQTNYEKEEWNGFEFVTVNQNGDFKFDLVDVECNLLLVGVGVSVNYESASETNNQQSAGSNSTQGTQSQPSAPTYTVKGNTSNQKTSTPNNPSHNKATTRQPVNGGYGVVVTSPSR